MMLLIIFPYTRKSQLSPLRVTEVYLYPTLGQILASDGEDKGILNLLSTYPWVNVYLFQMLKYPCICYQVVRHLLKYMFWQTKIGNLNVPFKLLSHA